MNRKIPKSLEGLEPDLKVAVLLYSIDSAFENPLTYVDVDCNLLKSQIEAVESLPSKHTRLKLAEKLLKQLKQSVA